MENTSLTLEELTVYKDSINMTDFMSSFSVVFSNLMCDLFPNDLKKIIGDEHLKSNHVKYVHATLNYCSASKNKCLELIDFIKSLDLLPSTQEMKDFISKEESAKPSSSYLSKFYEGVDACYDSAKNPNSSYDRIARDWQNYKKGDVHIVESEKFKTLQKISALERELLSLDPENILVSEFTPEKFSKHQRLGSLEGTLMVLRYRINWLDSLIYKLYGK